MFPDLRAFLAALESEGELLRVRDEADPVLEIATWAHLAARAPAPRASRTASAFDPGFAHLGGPALLFERVRGSDFPVAIQVYGSYRRLERALGLEESGGLEAAAERIGRLLEIHPPSSLREGFALARDLLPLARTPPRRVRRAPCQEVRLLAARGGVDLFRLPLLKCWPLDGDPTAVGHSDWPPERAGTAAGGGRYLTFGSVHTIHPDDEGLPRPPSHNVGMYRLQLVDRTRLAMHWHLHHDGAAHFRAWKERGRPMPVAIALGGESVLPYAATAPLPPGVSELLLAGFLQGRGIRLAPALTVPLRVPANAEIVIEGLVSTECGPPGFDPDRETDLGPGAVLEGPFGDHTGFYSMPDRYPILDVTAVTHRRGAVFPATVVGPPPQEDYALGKATERLFRAPLRLVLPDVRDLHLPRFGCFHNCAFVAIRKEYALQGRRVAAGIWGAGQMAWTKWIVLFDEDVALHDEAAALRRLFETCRFDRDVFVQRGPLDVLDHAAPFLGAGTKIAFDATRKLPGDDVGGVPFDERPRVARPSDEDRARLESLFVGREGVRAVTLPDVGLGRLLFLHVEKDRAGRGLAAVEIALARPDPLPLDLVVAIDARVPAGDVERCLFELCAQSDFGRDLFRRGQRLGVDATSKRPGDERRGEPVRRWPPPMEPDPEVEERARRRMRDLGVSV